MFSSAVIFLAAVIYVPGLLVMLPFTRRVSSLVGGAPLVSAGILAVASLLSGVSSLPWSLGLIAAVTVALMVPGLVLVGVRWRRGDFRGRRLGLLPTSWPLVVASVGALVAAGVLSYFMYRPAVDRPQAINQIYDTPFHLSVIRWIVDHADASSLHTAGLDGTAGANFYPSLWHGWTALATIYLGDGIPLAVNASVLVLLLLVWPLSIAWFASVALRRSWAFPVALGISGLFSAFPWNFLAFGPLYSNLFSYSLAPAYAAFFLGALRSALARRWDASWWANLAMVFLGFFAVALAQPNSVFTLAIMMFPAVCASIWSLGSSVKAKVISALGIVALCVVAVVCWVTLHDTKLMRRTVLWEWPPTKTPAEGAAAVLWQGMTGSTFQTLLGILVLAGLTLLLWHGPRWMVVSYLAFSLLYWLAASVSGTFRNYATGFWYHDSSRLAAAMVLVAVPVVSLLMLTAMDLISRGNDWARLLVLAACFAALLPHIYNGAALSERRFSIRSATAPSEHQFLNPAESRFAQTVAPMISGGTVAANPFDGSALTYPLYRIPVLFKAFDGNWMGRPTPDQLAIARRLNYASTSERVCDAVRHLDVRYVMKLKGSGDTLNYSRRAWEGIDQIGPGTPGFELVKRQGNFELYRITACQPLN